MSTANLDRAIAAMSGVLANVKPEQLSLATPCESWDVKALINHAVGATHYFAVAGEGGEMPAGEAPDFTEGDIKANFAAGAARAKAAFDAEGALQKMMVLPFGTMPGMAVMGLACTDIFTHAWDVAKATGQSTDLDPEFAAGLLAQSKAMIQPGFRGANGAAPFCAEATAPQGASAADQLAAFLGRTV